MDARWTNPVSQGYYSLIEWASAILAVLAGRPVAAIQARWRKTIVFTNR